MAVNGIIPTTVWVDPTITPGTTGPKIRAIHMTQLRTAIQNLENLVGNVSNCGYTICQSCQSIPCQTCQACQSCQSGGGECSDCDPSSCFVSGTHILMEDLSWKNVEELEIGDRVHGLTKVNTVIGTYNNILGNKRSIMTFADKSLAWTGEHLLWVKTKDDEFFGTCDFNHHLREKDAVRFPEFAGYTLSEREAIVIHEPTLFANLTGWKLDDPIVDRQYGDDTQVHTAIIDGDHTMIANGYVAGGFVHDDDFDYSQVKWSGLANV